MDFGWVATYGSSETMQVQISFASEGGSGTPVPDLSIEVDDLDEALRRIDGRPDCASNTDRPTSRGACGACFVRDPFGRLINILQHQS